MQNGEGLHKRSGKPYKASLDMSYNQMCSD